MKSLSPQISLSNIFWGATFIGGACVSTYMVWNGPTFPLAAPRSHALSSKEPIASSAPLESANSQTLQPIPAPNVTGESPATKENVEQLQDIKERLKDIQKQQGSSNQ